MRSESMRLLIAEHDPALGSLLRRTLSGEDMVVEIVRETEAALAGFLGQEPDLLILDADMAHEDGALRLLELVRQISPLCPVLVLVGRPEPEVRVECLERGADDCLAKPFSLRELRARCRAMLRRHGLAALAPSEPAREEPQHLALILDSLAMHRVRRQVSVAGEPVHLTNREFALLEQLLLAAGGFVSRAGLRAAVWKAGTADTNVIEVHIAALRRKLLRFTAAPVIETVRSTGYRLVPASTWIVAAS